MRKLLLSILLLFSSIAWCNQRYQGTCQQSGVTVLAGLNSTTTSPLTYPGATVTVNVVGGGLATIFSDNAGTPLANPFTASGTDATFSFYAANSPAARYSVTCSGTGIPTISINPDVVLYDPAVAIPGVFTTGAFSSNVTIGGTLSVTGASTFTSLNKRQFCDQSAGATWDAKVTACIAAAVAAGSGIADARGLTGAQTMAGNVTVPSGVVILLGSMQLAMGNFSIIGAAGAADAGLIGADYAGDQGLGNSGTILTYTGTGTAIQFGDTTTTSFGVEIKGIKVDITGAGNAAIAIKLLPTVTFRLHQITIAAKTTSVASGNAQEAIQLNGGTGAVGAQFTGTGQLSDIYITGGKYGIHAVSTDNTTTRVNNIQVNASVSVRTNVVGGDTRQSIYIENGDSWVLNGPDLESADVSLHLGLHASNNFGSVRSEGSVTSDILADVGSTENRINLLVEDVTNAKITDNATATNSFTSALDFRYNGVFGNSGWQPGALDLWAWKDSNTRWSIRKGHSVDQEFDIDFRNGSTAAVEWTWGVDAAAAMFLRTGGGNSVVKADTTNTFIDPPAAGGALFLADLQGTNGIRFCNGAGACNASMTSAGDLTATIGQNTPKAGSFTTASATGQITSTLAIGTAPLVITSTTPVANLTVQNCGATCAITQPTISTGVSQGSGLKHQRFGISCATGAAVGAVCNTTYTWTSAFADGNYTVTCTVDGVTSGVPTVNNVNTKAGANFNVSIAALTAAAAQATNVDCIAIHD